MLKHQQVSISHLKVLQLRLEILLGRVPQERNLFLSSRDISLICHVMVTPWEEAAERTKRFHRRKARQVVFAALEEIAPNSAEMLHDCLQSPYEDAGDIDSTLLGVLVECYQNAGHRSTRS